jgi:uncharacterized membrane protein
MFGYAGPEFFGPRKLNFMTTTDSFFLYLYRIFAGIMYASIAMLVATYAGSWLVGTPVWAVSGGNATLYLVKKDTLPALGERVLVRTDENPLVVGNVLSLMRQDGALSYRVRVEYDVPVSFHDMYGVVVASIPLVGLWMRMLATATGAMALIGAPLAMVFAHTVLHIPTVSTLLARRLQKKETKKGNPSNLFFTEELS